jgi:hypothetical protein
MESKLDTKMDGLKGEIMEVLKNFVTEKTPESENASHEIHDEDTRKVNQEWRNSNLGLKTNHVPKIDMRKFDGKDPIQWLQSLGTVAFNFQELFMKFSLEGKEIELRGTTGKPGKVISSNGMTKLLKKGHQGVIVRLCSLDVQTSKPSIPQDLQRIIDKHSKVFEDIPKGLPPT